MCVKCYVCWVNGGLGYSKSLALYMNHSASNYEKNVMGLAALKEWYEYDNMTESMDGNEDQLRRKTK